MVTSYAISQRYSWRCLLFVSWNSEPVLAYLRACLYACVLVVGVVGVAMAMPLIVAALVAALPVMGCCALIVVLAWVSYPRGK